jgi:hypothetical protein
LPFFFGKHAWYDEAIEKAVMRQHGVSADR